MKIIDFHCDTISRLMVQDKGESLKSNGLSVDIDKMKSAGSVAQFFAMYIDLKKTANPLQSCLMMIDRFYCELENNQSEILLARNYDEFSHNAKNAKVSAFLAIEEGGVLDGKIENLRIFYRLGVRLITLAWNYPNQLGYPNKLQECRSKGLTEFGREVVQEMNKLGMLVDVSHLSDQGFYDVAELSTVPFVASHSNARAITEHPRNLTDDMIKVIAQKGGAIGVNFEKSFTGTTDPGRIEDVILHIKHLRNIGGIDAVAWGSDFDGIGPGAAINSITELYKLINCLENNGFTADEIEKICFKNALRVIKASCK